MRRLSRSGRVARITGVLGSAYLRLVRATSTIVFEPQHPFTLYEDSLPIVGTLWHGQLFLLSLVPVANHRLRVLISNHGDGALIAAVAHNLGVETVRGSGGRDQTRWVDKGAVQAFLGLRASLGEGFTVCLTADISNGVPERAGSGVPALARASGRPVVGVALAARRRIVLKSWDRAVIPLPFNRIACVVTQMIEVPDDADDSVLENKRRELEDALNAATDRAYERVDGCPA